MLIQVVRNIDDSSSVRILVNNSIVRLSTLKNYFGQNVCGLKCYDSETGTWILCDVDSNGSILSEYRPWNSSEKYVLITTDDDDLCLPQVKRVKVEPSEESYINKKIEQTEQRFIHKNIVRQLKRFVGYILAISEQQQQESNITKNHTVTIVNDNHIVSHYHGELRCELKLGRSLYVKFPDIDEYTHHSAKVIYFNEKLDYVLMQTESILPQPRMTFPHDGDHVLLLAYSYAKISRTLCITSGIISSTKQDKYGHIRSHCGANKGDSGGGCFTASGELCGIVVGTDSVQPTAPISDLTTRYRSRAHIIPIELIMGQLTSMGLTKGQEPSYV